MNGLGNLIIGYNETTGANSSARGPTTYDRPGAGLSSFGGLVITARTPSAPLCQCYRAFNTASGLEASVSGGSAIPPAKTLPVSVVEEQ